MSTDRKAPLSVASGRKFVTTRLKEHAYPRQTDARTCGIAALAAFRARCDATNGGAFTDYLNQEHTVIARVQSDLHRVASRTGLPWPRLLGTSPWAVARLANRATGLQYHVRFWNESTANDVAAANADGHDVFVFVGERLLPRHVLLFLGEENGQNKESDVVRIFEPASGHEFATARGAVPAKWEGHFPEEQFGWWSRPILAVLPATRSS